MSTLYRALIQTVQSSWRQTVKLAVCVSLFASSFSPAFAGVLGSNLERATAEEAFTRDLRARIEQYMNANLGKIIQIRTCISAKLNPEKFPNVDKTYCANQLGIIRNNIHILYPKMRHFLIMTQLMPPVDGNYPAAHVTLGTTLTVRQAMDDLVDTIFANSYNDSLPKIAKSFLSRSQPKHYLDSFSLDNPLDSKFDRIEMPFRSRPTDVEMRRAIEGFPASNGAIPDFGKGVNQYAYDVCMLKIKREDLCKASTLKFEVKNRSTYWQTSIRDSKIFEHRSKDGNHWPVLPNGPDDSVIDDFKNEVNESLTNKYYEIIQVNPYVALVDNSNPSDQQLAWAFDQMFNSSDRTLKRFRAYVADLDRDRGLFRSTLDWFMAKTHHQRVLQLMDYTPIVGDVLDYPGLHMDVMPEYPFEALAQDLNAQNSRNQAVRTGIQVVGLLAANVVVCWLPWSRVASTAGRFVRFTMKAQKATKVLSPMCFALTSIPINTYFLWDSIHEYSVAYQEIFSGMQDQSYDQGDAHFIREVESLSPAKSAIFWTAIFMPMGTGPVRAMLRKHIPELSNQAWVRIERYLPKRAPK